MGGYEVVGAIKEAIFTSNLFMFLHDFLRPPIGVGGCASTGVKFGSKTCYFRGPRCVPRIRWGER